MDFNTIDNLMKTYARIQVRKEAVIYGAEANALTKRIEALSNKEGETDHERQVMLITLETQRDIAAAKAADLRGYQYII